MVFVVGIAVSGLFAALFMTVAAAGMRAFTDIRSGALAITVLAVGAVAGGCVGAWVSQLLIDRLLGRRSRR